MSRTVILFLTVITFCTVSAAQSSKANEDPSLTPTFSVRISTAKDLVRAGSEVRLSVTLTNTSERDISVFKPNADAQGELGGYAVELTDNQGVNPPETKYHRKLKTGKDAPGETSVLVTSGGYIPVKPGGIVKDDIILNKLYDLSQPGKYAIQVQRIDETNKILVKSNTVAVTVTP